MLCVDMNCLYLTYRSHILGECHDTSDNKTDADGYGCDAYTDGADCGMQDDEYFNSFKMCCNCGGGKFGNV